MTHNNDNDDDSTEREKKERKEREWHGMSDSDTYLLGFVCCVLLSLAYKRSLLDA
jgi:hypothetical protein